MTPPLSADCTPSASQPGESTRNYSALTLVIKGMAIPAFKNRKVVCGKRLVTHPKQKRMMLQIEESFACQLLSASQTAAAATSTGRSPLSWILSSVPADDCWTQVPEISVRAELCAPGDEGATVLIERLS